MHVARHGRALGVALGIGALVAWIPAGAASAQSCGYNYAGCTQPSVPAYSVGTTPATAPPTTSVPGSGASGEVAAGSAGAPSSTGLPFTGTDAAATAAAGVTAIGAGAVMVRRSRRRDRHPA